MTKDTREAIAELLGKKKEWWHMSSQKERPIIFSSDMICAILDNRKSQTRRVIKPQPKWTRSIIQSVLCSEEWFLSGTMGIIKCPYGKVGDRTIAIASYKNKQPCKHLGCFSHVSHPCEGCGRFWGVIPIEITDIRVERLQEISIIDCVKEGFIVNANVMSYHNGFKNLWNSLAKKGFKWEQNPWVWVVSFKKV